METSHRTFGRFGLALQVTVQLDEHNQPMEINSRPTLASDRPDFDGTRTISVLAIRWTSRSGQSITSTSVRNVRKIVTDTGRVSQAGPPVSATADTKENPLADITKMEILNISMKLSQVPFFGKRFDIFIF